MFSRNALRAVSRRAVCGAPVACVAVGAASSGPSSDEQRRQELMSIATPVQCESAAQQGVGAEMSMKAFMKSSLAQKWIELNSDKSQNCLINTDEQTWIETAAKGVRRKMLERIGGEIARATSVVEFAANASFPQHPHEGGEEFVVLDGDWIDDWGFQPKYTYVRNYIDSRHTPRVGPNGATIVARTCQMSFLHREPDHKQWDVSSANPGWQSCSSSKGRDVLQVYSSPYEEVRFEKWAPNAEARMTVPAEGEEIFVIEGSFSDDLGEHRRWSWARYGHASEPGEQHRKAGNSGCYLYVKSGHLRAPEVDLYALQNQNP